MLQLGTKKPGFKGVVFNKRVKGTSMSHSHTLPHFPFRKQQHDTVNGTLECQSLDTANLTVMGDVAADTVKSSRISTTLISADVLETGILRSPTNTITIDGNLVLAGANSGGTTSFLATEVIVGGVKQWRLLRHDDFDTDLNGWNAPGRGRCGEKTKDFFLGGHCLTSNGNASKIFSGLPSHNQIRITARVHFLDKWDGEVAFMRADSNVVWADTASSSSQSSLGNLCGGSHPDSRLSVPIDITIQHGSSDLEIQFGSSLQGDACDHSWAVDDVIIYSK